MFDPHNPKNPTPSQDQDKVAALAVDGPERPDPTDSAFWNYSWPQLAAYTLRLQRAMDARRRIKDEAEQIWTELNEFLNEQADNAHLCEEYEAALEEWTNSHPGYPLVGRRKEHDLDPTISISLTAPPDFELTHDDQVAIDRLIADYLNTLPNVTEVHVDFYG